MRQTESDDRRMDLSALPEANPDPVFVFKKNASLVYANPAGLSILDGRSIGDALGAKASTWLAEAVRYPGLCEVEFEHAGRTLQLKARAVPKQDVTMVSAHDVTALRRTQRELQDLNESLEQQVASQTFEVLLTQDVTILTLSSLAETRDPDTGLHLQRTRTYVRLLAEQLKEHPRFAAVLGPSGAIEMLYRSAPLHDIGKVGLTDGILLKPARLNDAEYDAMKDHTTLGGDALGWAEQRLGSNSFLQFAREICYCHHERWDGTGYPRGLAGEEIPVSARLMALADVYDALRSSRPYKPAWAHAEARTWIVKERERHFDPAVGDAFVAVEQQFRTISESIRDGDMGEIKGTGYCSAKA